MQIKPVQSHSTHVYIELPNAHASKTTLFSPHTKSTIPTPKKSTWSIS